MSNAYKDLKRFIEVRESESLSHEASIIAFKKNVGEEGHDAWNAAFTLLTQRGFTNPPEEAREAMNTLSLGIAQLYDATEPRV